MRASKALAIVVIALSVGVSACGEWTPPLPTAPSSASGGTTISGTVLGAADAFATTSFSTAATTGAGGTVTVVGTNISTTISGSGKFVLKGMPSGIVQLHFSGQGFNGTTTIHDVTVEHIQITVTITASVVIIESIIRIQPGNTADVDGVITSISHGDRSMKVNGLERCTAAGDPRSTSTSCSGITRPRQG